MKFYIVSQTKSGLDGEWKDDTIYDPSKYVSEKAAIHLARENLNFYIKHGLYNIDESRIIKRTEEIIEE